MLIVRNLNNLSHVRKNFMYIYNDFKNYCKKCQSNEALENIFLII